MSIRILGDKRPPNVGATSYRAPGSGCCKCAFGFPPNSKPFDNRVHVYAVPSCASSLVGAKVRPKLRSMIS